jgi:hypothetical protein
LQDVGQNIKVITFDVDWAPEWCVRQCLELCCQYGVKATFFATHPLPLLDSIAQHPDFELGIHPNFSPHSTQGKNFIEILDYCCALVDKPLSLRAHRLCISQPVYAYIAQNLPTIQNDSSLLAAAADNCLPYLAHYGAEARPLLHIPIHWEDDVAMLNPSRLDDSLEKIKNLSVFNFHPIHVALNSHNSALYNRLKTEKVLSEYSPQELADCVNSTMFGIKDTLRFILSTPSNFLTMNEFGLLVRRHLKEHAS